MNRLLLRENGNKINNIEISLELQCEKDANFVSKIISDEMDNAIEDATGGIVSSSEIKLFEFIENVSNGNTIGKKLVYDRVIDNIIENNHIIKTFQN